MDKIKLQNLFGFPLIIKEQDCVNLTKMPISGSIKKSYLHTAPKNNYLDLGNLFSEVVINFFEDGSYKLIFRGDTNNCKKELTANRVLFYNALHKILGEDSEGAKSFSYTDFINLHSGSKWIYTKVWDNYGASLDYLGPDMGLELVLESQVIDKKSNIEIDLTPELYSIHKPTQPSTKNNAKSQNKKGKKGCLKTSKILLLLWLLVSLILSALISF